MKDANYASSSEMLRNIQFLRARHEVLAAIGSYRIVRFERPYVLGSEFWVVDERGFLWEPADSQADAVAYIERECQ